MEQFNATPPQVVRGQSFDVGPRYSNLSYLGAGAYGTVCSATDSASAEKTMVAIKKIGPLENIIFCQRTLREIKILTRFHHENIVSVLDILVPPSADDLIEVYIVQNLMAMDLGQYLRTHRLGNEHKAFFLYQMLRGLKYIHSANVIHRDLKPSNILLNANSELKICDFGMARVVDPTFAHQKNLTEYVVTRWYRAPEIMLTARAYCKAIDVWSVGCIFAEMQSNKPIFPGRDSYQQLHTIFNVMGSPNQEDLEFVSDERVRSHLQLLPYKPKISWSTLYPKTDQQALNLLDSLLTFNPHKRVTAAQALTHPYLENYCDPDDEAACDRPFTYETELDDFPEAKLNCMIYEEAIKFNSLK